MKLIKTSQKELLIINRVKLSDWFNLYVMIPDHLHCMKWLQKRRRNDRKIEEFATWHLNEKRPHLRETYLHQENNMYSSSCPDNTKVYTERTYSVKSIN